MPGGFTGSSRFMQEYSSTISSLTTSQNLENTVKLRLRRIEERREDNRKRDMTTSKEMGRMNEEEGAGRRRNKTVGGVQLNKDLG